MSGTDARMAFERHATSKINKADDLFSIKTLGFRGEALASIAAIATVELKTKKNGSDLGTNLIISASKVVSQNTISCSDGSNFSVKNLFFNVPARRKFLKTDSTEFHHIIDEFQKVALTNPNISFTLIHNNSEIYNLPESNLRQRILNIFGKNINQQIIPLNTETSIVSIFGFIGKPEFSKKNSSQQFFFVNNRFMRHPYFNKAVLNAYENIIKPNDYISYFIYFSVKPDTLDVNIHPTKTEIKFEDETSIWQILRSSVKETLGKFNIVPSIDFDIQTPFEIPVTTSKTEIKPPQIKINPEFNPFNTQSDKSSYKGSLTSPRQISNLNNWEQLFEGFERENKNMVANPTIFSNKAIDDNNKDTNIYDATKFFQFKSKYIITAIKSGLMVIDQKKAHERILYEKFLNSINIDSVSSQKILYPKKLEFNPSEKLLLKSILPNLQKLGFVIDESPDNTFIVTGTPVDIIESDIENVINNTIENYKLFDNNIKFEITEKIADSLSRASAINYGKILNTEEIRNLIDSLFACKSPGKTPSGKNIIIVINTSEIEKKFDI